MNITEHALEFIQKGHVVGLGTGRAATDFVRALGRRVKAGLRIRGVPTSQATADLAQQLGIPLTTLNEVERIDVTVDGADEVDPQLDLMKGLGGALVREKIVAAASERLVIVVGSEKLVPLLGTRGILPVEVVPFGLVFCRTQLLKLECDPSPRVTDGRLFQTDNGNHILDCKISVLTNPAELEQAIQAVPGVVGTGLFLGMAHTVLVQDGEEVEILERGSS
ncbi:MAG: ribose-5-phosphate isomerase RpiA [candidate division NC10 bacterium]|nr:ribose-5-phosphate isomerase RpiA [candidate division NC10 bacterium]